MPTHDTDALAVDICSHSGRHTAGYGDHDAEKWGPCSQCAHHARVVEPILAPMTNPRVAAAIVRVEESRQTHVEWRDYWLAYEAHACDQQPCPWESVRADQEAIAGDLAHHQRAIAEYDNVLACLTARDAVVAAQAKAEALREAADEVHTEARWQMEREIQTAPGSAERIIHVYAGGRMSVVEQILRDFATAASSVPQATEPTHTNKDQA